jgi:diamine N-acetyltransferase
MDDPLQRGPEDVALRPAGAADALCLSVLAMQVFLDTYATEGIRPAIAREVLSSYSQAAFDEALLDTHTRIVVAERMGHLIGFAQLTLGATHPDVPGGAAQAELLRLYVQEPFTGRHVGSRLLAEAERLAAQAGAALLWLTPWVHNHRALVFYQRRGYADHGHTHFVFEGESHENRLLVKGLVGTTDLASHRAG